MLPGKTLRIAVGLGKNGNEDQALQFVLQAHADVVCFKESVVGILVEVNGNILLEGGLQLPFKVIDESGYPAVVFVVFLAVGNEDVVSVAWNYRRHVISGLRLGRIPSPTSSGRGCSAEGRHS